MSRHQMPPPMLIAAASRSGRPVFLIAVMKQQCRMILKTAEEIA